MSSTRVNITGQREVINNLRKVTLHKREQAQQAFTDKLNIIMGESVKECPVDMGALRGSATVQVNKGSTDIEGRLGYNMDYAIFVHENLTARHKVGKAKFLEDPVNRHKDDIVPYIIRRCEK